MNSLFHLLLHKKSDCIGKENEKKKKKGLWTTDVEMLGVSHLLNVPVFCFLKRIQRWQRLAPNNVDRILLESEPGEMVIYMYHLRDHFDVVMSV